MSDKSELSAATDNHSRGREVAEVYGAAAPDYFRAGWQPLPLPPGAKWPPPKGFTGADGRLIGSVQTIKQWARDPRGAAGNVGLHLIGRFVGIDVDTHGEGDEAKVGAATLAAAEAELGALPPTLISSARPDPLVSGIRVFKLPDGYPPLTPGAEELLNERFGPDIDVISQAYRYIVAWPSTNPDADGAPYRWYAQHGDGSIGHPLAGVPSLSEVTELPTAWADLLTGGKDADGGTGGAAGSKSRSKSTVDPRRAQANAQAVEKALALSPFDPADAELDDLDIDVADAVSRLYSRDRAEAEIEEWLDRLRTARKAKRRGQSGINETLRDVSAHLWHYVPHFLTADQWREALIEAQRQAWVASGGADDGDYSGANVTIDRTVREYVPAQIARGTWWVAVLDEDDEDDEAVTSPRTGSDLGKYEGSQGGPVMEDATDDEGDDPTEIDEWDAPTRSASSSSSGSSGTRSAASGADGAADAGAGDGGDAEVDPDVADMLALRERRRAEKAAKVEAEQFAELLRTERLRRRARAAVDEEEAVRKVDPERKARLLADFLTSEQLDEIPPLEPLIEGWLFKGTLAQIFGPSGHYKSFVAADMMRAVATGEPWFGHEVTKGRVCYIVAEGVQGFRARIRAIEQARNLGRLTEITIVRRAVQIGGPEWGEFIEIIAEGGYDMVVVDTQARTTVGRKENDNAEMGEVVAALDELIEGTGVGVVMIHHSGKGEAQDGRGASAIKGALQSQIRVVKRKGLTVEVAATKQKDHEELGPYFLQLEEVGESLVVTANRVADGMAPDRREEREAEQRKLTQQVDANDFAALETRPAVARVLAAVFGGGDGATKAEVRAAYDGFLVEAGKPKCKIQTFGSAWTKLGKDGHLLKHPERERHLLSIDGCKVFGIPFERPGWITPDEWEEAITEGKVDLSAVAVSSGGSAGPAITTERSVVPQTRPSAGDFDETLDDEDIEVP